MSATISITEDNVFSSLRTFILSIVPANTEVIITQDNGVPMPKGGFVAMTKIGAVALATNKHGYSVSSETIIRPTQYTIQIDCYGANAGEWSQMIATLLRDDYAIQSFKTSGFDIAPLYADDSHQLPLIDGEEQYETRWTFNAVLQYNPVVSFTTQTANTLAINTVNVDRTYPP